MTDDVWPKKQQSRLFVIFPFMCLVKLFLFLFAVLLRVELWNEKKQGRGGSGVACIPFHDFYQEIPKLQ